MERIDGYLVIDDCKRVVSDKDKNHYWIYIEGVEYYFKEVGNKYRELVGYQAAKYLGIDACYTDLAILDGKRGVISKSLRNNKSKLVSGDELLGEYLAHNFDNIRDMGFIGSDADNVKEYGLGDTTRYLSSIYINNLEIIWQALEDRYKDKINISEVMEQFVIMYMFTILFSDIDKHPGNWFIEEGKDGVRLAPILDNGDLLINYDDGYEADNVIMSFSTNFKDRETKLVETLKVFFETSSYEYFLMFVSMFDKVFMNFDIILQNVEKQIGREIPDYEKEKIIVAFNKNCSKIQSVIDRYRKRKR